ncbi:recombinase family protein [Amycolatopsis samaneae]|uniref:Recombinase family protein n=1 Tax=Amycolatopsis samaneae TaxID=664691 RepID=A0ABW5GU23_9PSEU
MTGEVYPKTAVRYLRTACHDNGESRAITAQRHACQRRADELGLEVVREYVDYGSGLKADRPGLIKLLADLKAAPPNYVICFDHACLAQDVNLLARICWTIRTSGARLELAGLPHQEPGALSETALGQVGERQVASFAALEVMLCDPAEDDANQAEA